MEAVHSIQMAARLTGLSQNLIRAWEQRYGAVEPNRSATKRRLYSQEEIGRLSLLKELTAAGHSIGHIAKLPDERLRELVGQAASSSKRSTGLITPVSGAEQWLDESVLAIRDFDHQRLGQTLKEAAGFLGVQGVLQRVLAPLAERVGDLWRKGEITAAHEHFGTNIIRRFLDEISSPFPSSESGPVLVVATPAGQLHEMGALMAGALAANLGWRVTHLGASLPAVEIAGAARQKKARAVAMSLIYPGDDPSVADEIRMLRSSLPSECAIIAGGRAMEGYREVLETTGALMVENLPGLGIVLDRLRQGGRGAGPRK